MESQWATFLFHVGNAHPVKREGSRGGVSD